MQEQVNHQLKNIVPRGFWGLQHNPSGKLDGILPISDHQIIFVVGSRLAILDYSESHKSKLTYLGPRKITEIIHLTLSADLKYVAASVKVQGCKATMLVHQIEAKGVSQFRSPRLIQHDASDIYLGMSFSADSSLIVAFTNILAEGVLIYDRIREVLLRSVPIGSLVTSVSFNPDDSTRICTVGALLQFWRYTAKAVHNAPIAGLHSSTSNYTCHVWLPDRRVAVGTSTGELIVVHQSSVQSTHLAFGTSEQHNYDSEGEVITVLADDNNVVAASSINSVAVFGIVRLTAGASTISSINPQVALVLKAKFRLGSGVSEIRGLQLSIKSSTTSDSTLLVMTQTSLSSFELLDAPPESHPEHSPFVRGPRPVTPFPFPLSRPNTSSAEPELADLAGKVLYSFHGSQIDRLCLSTRSSSFVTSSQKDNTIRVWDSTKPYSSSDVTEDYSEHRKDMPLEIALHPSGWTLACATRDSVVSEFAITLSGLRAVRQVVAAKIPFISLDGTSYAPSSPVSLLKIFHLYDLDYSCSEVSTEKHGRPKRVMTIAAHGSAISDFTFSSDDSTAYSCALDGTVYSHAVSVIPSPVAVTYSGEYFTRGATALKIVTNASKLVIVCYDSSGDSRVSQGGHLAVWSGGQLTDSPMLIQLDMPVRDIALGTSNGDSNAAVCVMGYVDGSVLMSFFPFPVMSREVGLATSSNTREDTVSLGLGDASSLVDLQVQGLEAALQGERGVRRPSQSRSGPVTHAVAKAATPFEDHHVPSIPAVNFLDTSRCKVFYLHAGPVTSVIISADGSRIFSTGSDGAVFMLALARPLKTILNGEEEEDRAVGASDMLSESPGESALMLADKRSFERLRSHTAEMKIVMEDRLRDSEKAFSKLAEQTEVRILELEAKLKREVSKRDAIILNERDDHRRQKQQLNGELSSFEQRQSEIVARVELGYEQKLAQEALYLDRMRQAYEEVALHTRLDKKKARDAVIETQLKDQAEAAFSGKLDAAKQKEALLTYVGYVSTRHDEILNSLEKAHEKERMRLRKEAAALTLLLETAKTDEIRKETVTNRLASQLSMEVAAKEDQLLRLKNDLDWAEGRVERLEGALQQATWELKKGTEMYEKWEFKAGDQQQQISEMERIRKALTVQIHGLRQEIGPKEEQLLLISEKLQEMDREYDLALKAVSDKEILLSQRSASLHMLQKQVRDLRSSSAAKDSSLRRAALLFEQYRQTLLGADCISATISKGPGSGKAAQKSAAALLSKTVSSVPPTISRGSTQKLLGGSLKSTPSLALNSFEDTLAHKTDSSIALQRLCDVLRPHLVASSSTFSSTSTSMTGDSSTDMTDEASNTRMAHLEKEKQVKQLHKNVTALKGNLEKNQMLSNLKAKNQLSDNELLLKEVSDMRHEIRQLSMDNHRLRSEAKEAPRRLHKEPQPRAVSVTGPFVGSNQGLRSEGVAQGGDRKYSDDDYDDTERGELLRARLEASSPPLLDDMVFASHRNLPPRALVIPNSLNSEMLSADQKISALMALNQDEIRSDRTKKTASDNNIVAITAQDILNFHLPGSEGPLSPAPGAQKSRDTQASRSLGAGTGAGTVKSGASKGHPRLNTASIQLPDVAKPPQRFPR